MLFSDLGVNALRLEIKRRPQKKSKNKQRVLGIIILVAGVAVGAFSLFGVGNSTMLREVAQSELESIAFDIVGRTVEEELAASGENYGDFVSVERDASGRVSAITTNMQQLNLLKLRIANKLSEEMFIRTEDTVTIPLGNLTGIDFLTGFGPRMKFKVLWVSSVDGEFSNSFTSAGINQTLHRIMLDFTINVGMMFAGREIGVDVGTSVCVAETVIVGEIPKFFSDK